MDNSSSTSKRRSLTLSSRLLQKRHSASPQNRVRASATQDVERDVASEAADFTLENVDSTPPHKKQYSLDDSLDFSPHANLSPSCLFSQTLVTGSPEVSWRWNSDGKGRGDKVNTTSDSGFDSEEFGAPAARRKQKVDAAFEYRRKQLDNKQRRAQQMRDHELLRERCDKLHRHLEQQFACDATTQPVTPSPPQPATPSPPQPVTPSPPQSPPSNQNPVAAATDAALEDFLNDSDTDCFLLEATQQLESNLVPKQPAAKQATTPTSHHRKSPKENHHRKSPKEKRASFYMKFLEDESESEDWFSALDEVMLEASQAKKPRTSLLRYKSMPNNTTTSTTSVVTNGSTVSSSLAANTKCSSSTASSSAVNGKLATPGIKRHASSHALSPATSSGK
ncbi:hypothetical protein KR044_006908 [Drosophila immigrans]|nr:hypothetical protein KR044_006908 [Drosophila immigrans]